MPHTCIPAARREDHDNESGPGVREHPLPPPLSGRAPEMLMSGLLLVLSRLETQVTCSDWLQAIMCVHVSSSWTFCPDCMQRGFKPRQWHELTKAVNATSQAGHQKR